MDKKEKRVHQTDKLLVGIWSNFEPFKLLEKPADVKLQDYKPFREWLENIKDLGVNVVCFFTSDVKFLQELCPIMHENGIEVYVAGGGSLGRGVKCIRDGFVERAAKEFLAKVLSCDIDGVFVGPDEFHFIGHALRVPPGDRCITKFKEKFGLDSPPDNEEDSPKYRKWIQFRYESVAEAFRYWNNYVKERRPDLARTSIVGVGPLCHNETMRFGLAYDLIGHIAGFTYFQTDPYIQLHNYHGDVAHYYAPETVKKFVAGATNRRTVMTLQNSRLRIFHKRFMPVEFYGTAISCVAHGCKGILSWHYNAIIEKGYWEKEHNNIRTERFYWVKGTFDFVHVLDEWGVREMTIPQKIALLYSRGSNDLWWIKNFNSDVEKDGHIADQVITSFLLRNGFPFEPYYLDQVGDLSNIGEYKLVVLPFPYSVSEASFQALKNAVRGGSNVLFFQHKGEVNEEGELRRITVFDRLSEMAERKGIIEFTTAPVPLLELDSPEQSRLVDRIDGLLGKERPLTLNRGKQGGAQDIEATVLQRNERDQVLFVINWEHRAADVELGLNVPSGSYEVNTIRLYPADKKIRFEKGKISIKDFHKFILKLLPQEATALHISTER